MFKSNPFCKRENIWEFEEVRMILRIGLFALLLATPAVAQNRLQAPVSAPTADLISATDSSALPGKWTYRSFINTADLVGGDAQKALNLIFGEGIFTFALSGATLTGTFDMGGGYVLDLQGRVQPAIQNAPLAVEISGVGRANTPTADWEYDYHGYLAYHWPNGVNQAAALVGSVIRAKPHDGTPAGLVASFIAVKQP
jgi:hypothetical protein